MEYIKLANNTYLPLLGFGTYEINNEIPIIQALNNGYRLIDTAFAYQNEHIIAKAIKNSGISRKNIFLTTKVWIQDAGYKKTIEAFQKSLDKLETDYIDLYLIHYPYNDYYGSWHAMQDLYNEGKIKAIGVSNFPADKLIDLYINSEIKPMINQIEINPFYQQTNYIQYMKNHNIQVQAWSPLCKTAKNILHNPKLSFIAQKHNKTTAQIILRWHIQRGISAIPKSENTERIASNIDIFDFELDNEDMHLITRLDTNTGYENINYHNPSVVEYFNSIKF